MEDLMKPNDFMTEFKKTLASQIMEKEEEALIKFCKEKGYEVETPDDFIKIQNKLKKEGKFIRCESFTKFDGNTATTKVITFIDNIEYSLSRSSICELSGLSKEGYFW